MNKRYFHTNQHANEDVTVKKYFAPGSRHTFKLKEHFAPIAVRCITANKTTAVVETTISSRNSEASVMLISLVDREAVISVIGKNGNVVHRDFTGIYNEGEGFFTTETDKKKVFKQVAVGDILTNTGKSERPLTILAVGPDGALFGCEDYTHLLHGEQKRSRIVPIDSQQSINLGIQSRKVGEL